MGRPADPDGREPSIESLAALDGRFAESRARAREIALRLSQTAGKIAATEIESARVHDEIAAAGISAIAPRAAEHADQARRFAAEERAQQQWLAALADRGPADEESPTLSRGDPAAESWETEWHGEEGEALR